MKLRWCPSLFWLALLLTYLSCQDSRYYPLPEAEGGWRKQTDPGFLHSLGLDSERLEEFGHYNLSVSNTNWKPYSDYQGTLVIKDGWIVGEWYNTPDARNFKTYISSNGKAVAAICLGIMVRDSRDGHLSVQIDPSSKLYHRDWLPGGFPLSDPLKAEITLEHVLQHTSGICPERTGTGEAVEQGRNDWTNYENWILGHDPQWPQTGQIYFPPGQPEEWVGNEVWAEDAGGYSSVAFGHLGLILANVYEKPAREFLWNRLLEPIGFSGIEFHAPPSEEIEWFSAGGLRMTPRDYARFAYFLLRDGQWNGQQIVDISWVKKFRESTAYINIRSNQDGFFGQYPKEMFRIAGSGLNWAFIIPSLDLIAIRTGRASNGKWDEVEQKFLQKLFAAVDSPPLQSSKYPGAGKARIVPSMSSPSWLEHEDGAPFFLAGPGDPEGFLYRGEINPDGTRNGDQMDLIGKMKGTGANCIYLMSIRSHGGDGDQTENPFVDHDPDQGLSPAVLDQWEQWFTVMDRTRITTFFFFFDDGARLAKRRAPLSEQERQYIRDIVNRFKHHDYLIWSIAEEYQEAFTSEQIIDFAAEIRSADEYGHPIAVHKLSGTDFAEFDRSELIDQFAIQLGSPENPADLAEPKKIHRQVLEAWRRAEGRYNLNLSELAGHYVPGDRAKTRQKSWAAAMAGAYVMVIDMDIESSDGEALADCGRMVRFFESTDFYRMKPSDELARESTEYVLASSFGTYILYSSDAAGPGLGVAGLKPGQYDLRWFDCENGQEILLEKFLVEQGPTTWPVPAAIGPEVALYITRR